MLEFGPFDDPPMLTQLKSLKFFLKSIHEFYAAFQENERAGVAKAKQAEDHKAAAVDRSVGQDAPQDEAKRDEAIKADAVEESAEKDEGQDAFSLEAKLLEVIEADAVKESAEKDEVAAAVAKQGKDKAEAEEEEQMYSVAFCSDDSSEEMFRAARALLRTAAMVLVDAPVLRSILPTLDVAISVQTYVSKGTAKDRLMKQAVRVVAERIQPLSKQKTALWWSLYTESYQMLTVR